MKAGRVACAPFEENELSRVGDGERAEHDGIDEAKDGGVGADAESEGEDGDGGKSRRVAQGTEGVAEVLQEFVDPDGSPDGARVFFHARDVAEFAEGGVASVLGRHAAGDVRGSLAAEEILNFAAEIFEDVFAAAHGLAPWRT